MVIRKFEYRFYEARLFCHSGKSRSDEQESAFLDSVAKLPATADSSSSLRESSE